MDEIVKSKIKNVMTLKNIDLIYSGENGVVTALQNINLNIGEREFVCLLGPSGCGKSTLLNIAAGFIKPTAGKAKMDDDHINGPNWHRGVIFQNPTLYPWLNIQDNISFGLKMRKFPTNEINQLTNKYIELVGLNGFEKYKPYELSGGMKQRACLARALVNKPRMLLMDEPFGALDALTRLNMQTLIREIWKKTGNTVLFITHDVDEALVLATRIIIMSRRPGCILKEFNTEFTYRISNNEDAEVRCEPEYLKTREEILSIINSQDKQKLS